MRLRTKIRTFLFVVVGLTIIVYFQNCAKIKSDGVRSLSSIGSGFDDQVMGFGQQPDGKLLVGGYFGLYNGEPVWPNEGLIRLNPDGSRDRTFDTNSPGFHIGSAIAFLVQRNGKIIVYGNVYIDSIGDHPGLVGTQSCLAARLNPDGSYDPSFVCNKIFNFTASGLNNIIMLEQNDGKIIVEGKYWIFGTDGTILDQKVGVFRLNTNGTLDTTFHSLLEDPNTTTNSYIGLAQDASGRLLVTGTNYGASPATPIFKRLSANGDVDSSFHPTTAIQNVQSVAVQSDGKIVIGGTNIPNTGNVIARFNSDGTPDATFNANAIASGITHMGEVVRIQPDGKIIFAGMKFSNDPTPGKPAAITRLNANGTRDLGFDQAAGTGSNSQQIYYPSLAVEPNGNIFYGGLFTLFNGISVSNIVLLSSQGGVLQ